MKELLAKGEWPAEERYLRAEYQTAGRGQAGNGWESEEGKNLLCSILLPPRENLFELNIVVAVAVRRLLGEGFTIKWPNDIYYGDRKIAGILIENAFIGNEVKYSIAGIGLNVNQTEWYSDAPNPVSLKQITGKEHDLGDMMRWLYEEIQKALLEDVWDEYKAHLYRREGWWPFAEREVSVVPSRVLTERPANLFMAQIKAVTEQGELVLETKEGTKKYHFKEVQFVL